MNKQIVINTSPLIALGKMRILDLIARLPLDFICPMQVKTEMLAGASKGYPVNFPSWIRVMSLKIPLTPLALANLDAGEAAVIELASVRSDCLAKQKRWG